MNGDGTDLIQEDTDYLVTKTTIRANAHIEDIVRIIREQKISGSLCLHLHNGGVRRIELKEETRAPERSRDQLRKILELRDKIY